MRYTATNIRLPKRTLQALKIRAAKEDKSLAQMIRDAIEKTYHIGGDEKGIDPKTDPFYHLIGAWESGLQEGAVKHDRDIYGVGE